MGQGLDAACRRRHAEPVVASRLRHARSPRHAGAAHERRGGSPVPPRRSTAMRRILTTAATLALMTSAPGFVSSAFAHGGSYRGPAGEVPPDSREPSDPPPPPEGGGPQTPGGAPGGGPTTGGPDAGGPSTPGGGGGGPSSGGGPSGPPPAGGGGPTTGGGKGRAAAKGAGYEDWTFWWNYNKDEILQLKSAVKRMNQGPTTSGGAGGFGKKMGGSQAIRTATDESIQRDIVPL